MSTKRFLLATLAGALTLFVTGFLIWGLALMDFFAANTGSASGVIKEVPLMWALGVGQIGFAAALTLVIGKWAGISAPGPAAKAGALLGLLLAIGFDFTMYGTTNISNLTATVVDPLLTMIQVGIGGAVIGLVLGKVRESPA